MSILEAVRERSAIRMTVPVAKYAEAEQACIELVNINGVPIQLRADSRLPDNVMILFVENGSFQMINLEEQ